MTKHKNVLISFALYVSAVVFFVVGLQVSGMFPGRAFDIYDVIIGRVSIVVVLIGVMFGVISYRKQEPKWLAVLLIIIGLILSILIELIIKFFSDLSGL